MTQRTLQRRWPTLFVAAISAAAATAAGCSGEDSSSTTTSTSSAASSGATSGTGGAGGAGETGGAGGAGGAGGGSSAIPWGKCIDGFQTECAAVELPLDHEKPEEETIPVYVSRQLAKSGASKQQLWFLQGGPGGSGNVFGSVFDALADLLPDVDFYVLEHRGVGGSARLGCPAQEAPNSPQGVGISETEWPACIAAVKAEWGEKLEHFRTTNDARDLHRLIELTRGADQKVFIFGVSYGTTRALRFLQAFPDGADGVILDSVVSPGVQYLSQFDEQYDPVVKSMADICAANAECGSKMGQDVWASVTSTVDKLNAGHCPTLGMSAEVAKSVLSIFVQVRGLREHLFPLLYRIDRCDAADVIVVQHYMNKLIEIFSGGGSGPVLDSAVLQAHVALSEMWEKPTPTAAELTTRCDDAYFCPGIGPYLGPLYDTWPLYTPDAFADKWPTTSVPILAMNGTLDPQTPIGTAQAIKDQLKGPSQTFVSVEYCPHGVLFESPVVFPGTPPCGMQMMLGFMADPAAPIDTACLADLKPVDFVEDPAVVQEFFGAPNMWENMMPAALIKQPPASIDWKALTEAARRRIRRSL